MDLLQLSDPADGIGGLIISVARAENIVGIIVLVRTTVFFFFSVSWACRSCFFPMYVCM